MSDRYDIYGGLGSPYSMKMRAVMRYRRLPHVWHQMRKDMPPIFSHVKAPVIPVVHFPDGTWLNDSTPLVFELEKRHPGQRSIIPDDEAQAFLAYLIEDFADEWGTKPMFLYRWLRERDQVQMSEWLSFDRLAGSGKAAVMDAARMFRERQVGRMALVGCTQANAPLIETSTKQLLALLEAHVTEEEYLFGSRPSLADFGWMGQLSQLAVDPTPAEMMRGEFPFTFRWLMNLDDASGVEGKWRDPFAPLSPALKGFLKLAGDVYFPFLLANAAAAQAGKDMFEFSALGMPYSQGVFKYQVKCLAELRAAYAKLSPNTKLRVDPVLEEAHCLRPLRSG
jgi:glutathione S-transferase